MNVSNFSFGAYFFHSPEFYGIYLYAITTKLPYCCSLYGLLMKEFALGPQPLEQMRWKAPIALDKSLRVHQLPLTLIRGLSVFYLLQFTPIKLIDKNNMNMLFSLLLVVLNRVFKCLLSMRC